MLDWLRRCYRRSKLGPFRLTISMGALAISAYRTPGCSRSRPRIICPAVGVRSLGLIVEGAVILAESKQVRLPLSAHAYRAVRRSAIIFARNAVVAVIFSIRPGWTGLLALPGLRGRA